jgi:serine protease Do
MAKSVMNQLVAHGKVTRGYLGLLPQDINDAMAKAMGLKSTQGSLVGDVTPDGPAEKAGIARGDIITAVNGTTIENSAQLRNMVAETAPGSTAVIELLREGKSLKLSLKVGERPKDLAANGRESPQPEESTNRRFGLAVTDLSPAAARTLGYQNQHGALVTSVTPGSPADDAGLQKNDLLQEVNRKPVRSAEEFADTLKKADGASGIVLLARRGDRTFFVALQPTS